MKTVWIKHRKLPDSPPVEVPASSLPEHLMSGWEETDPPPPPEPDPDPDAPPTTEQPTTNEAPADAGASAFPESPRRRRASTTEDK